MTIARILECGMLVSFGVSWPFNIVKSIRSRTARGKSIIFEMIVIFGYIVGVTGKFISGNINYVVFFYFLDIILVGIDLILTFRNRHLDREADRRAEAAGTH